MTRLLPNPTLPRTKPLVRSALALMVLTSIGCSNGSSRLPGVARGSGAAPSVTGPIETGDVCTTKGAQTACGTAVRQEPDYVVCAVGVRTCQNGIWGNCVATGQRHNTESSRATSNGGHHESLWQLEPLRSLSVKKSTTIRARSLPAPTRDYLVDGGVTLKLVKVELGSSTCTSLKNYTNSGTLAVNQLSPLTTSPSQVTVTAELQPSGCYPATTPVLWSIDRTDIATIDSGGHLSLVTPISTPIVITGHSGDFTGSATIQVSVNVADNHLAPVGTAAQFTGTSSADTVSLLYPYAQTVLPLGLPSPLLQWSTGANGAAAAVKISLRYPAATGTSFSWSDDRPRELDFGSRSR